MKAISPAKENSRTGNRQTGQAAQKSRQGTEKRPWTRHKAVRLRTNETPNRLDAKQMRPGTNKAEEGGQIAWPWNKTAGVIRQGRYA